MTTNVMAPPAVTNVGSRAREIRLKIQGIPGNDEMGTVPGTVQIMIMVQRSLPDNDEIREPGPAYRIRLFIRRKVMGRHGTSHKTFPGTVQIYILMISITPTENGFSIRVE